MSNRQKKVGGDSVERAGCWAVGSDRTSLRETEKEVRVGDETVDIGQEVLAGGWVSEEGMTSMPPLQTSPPTQTHSYCGANSPKLNL